MITERIENFKLGAYDTVQTFYTCDACKEETNAVEWYISVIPYQVSIYTCPLCKAKHKFY